MNIQTNPTNFESHIVRTEPLKNFFAKVSVESNLPARKRMINNINALLNDGTNDVIEIKKVLTPKGEYIRAFVNDIDSHIACIIDETRKIFEADSMYEVVSRLVKKRNPLQKVQKFGFKKLEELRKNIFG